MEFKYINSDEFKSKWKNLNNYVSKTEEIEVDPSIIRTAYDFKKYFGYLTDLKPNNEYDFV